MSEKKKVQRYENDKVVVQFDPNICEHAAECVHGLDSVFNIKNRPWVNVDGASPEEIAQVIAKCPTGALKFERKGESASVETSTDTPMVMTLVPNGPIRVAGKFIVKDDKGVVLAEMEKASLCRCGLSANKPFCDGSHKREDWKE